MDGEDKVGDSPLVEGRDFYWESGLIVMTESFLRRRGYCCESKCRHCPYGKEAGPDQYSCRQSGE